MATSEQWWQEQSAAYAQVVAKAWSDDNFRNLLLSNSKEALAQCDIKFPPGFDLKVVPGGKATRIELPLPEKPPGLGEHTFHSKEAEAAACCCCC